MTEQTEKTQEPGITVPGGGRIILDQPWQIEMAGLIGARAVLSLKVRTGMDRRPGATEIMRQARAGGITTGKKFTQGLRDLERYIIWKHAGYGLARPVFATGSEYDDDWNQARDAVAAFLAEQKEKEAADAAAGVEGVQPAGG